ncbi:Uncharacterised protein [uncultured archaeon]|nr:Uncharacterised protein [uncultured archaeon]
MNHEMFDKNFLIITIVWFVASYLILWAIGGACINPVNGTGCLAQNSLLGIRNVPILGLLIPFDTWNSLMYFLLPIVGYIFAFFIIGWWNDYFDTKEAATIAFPILLIVVLFLGYFINLSFYAGEAANLNSSSAVKYSLYFCMSEAENSQCSDTVYKINNELYTQAQAKQAKVIPQDFPVAFWPEIRKSVFFLFILGAIAGWIPLFARSLVNRKEESD